LTVSRLSAGRPFLRGPIGIAHSCCGPKHQPHHQTPGVGVEKIRINNPAQSSTDNQRSEQFRPDSDSLSEPRIKRIIGGGHNSPTGGARSAQSDRVRPQAGAPFKQSRRGFVKNVRPYDPDRPVRYSPPSGQPSPLTVHMTSPFTTAFLQGPPQPLVVTLPLPAVDPLELYRRLDCPERPALFLESGHGTQTTARYSIIGTAPYMTLVGKGWASHRWTDGCVQPQEQAPFAALQQKMADSRIARPPGIPPFFGGAIGFLAYDLVRTFETLPTYAIDDVPVPDVAMAFFDLVTVIDHQSRMLFLMYCPPLSRFLGEPREKLFREGCDRLAATEAALAASISTYPPTFPLAKARFRPEQSREEYVTRVQACQEYIGAGDIYQANLSHRFRLSAQDSDEDAFGSDGAIALYQRLRRVNPSPFSGLVRFGDISLVSCSPERLVRLDGNQASTRPIAGTRPRGRAADEDGRYRAELLASTKERAEHLMLVDLERNDLGKVCTYGSVRVDEFMTIEQYSHVSHLVSDVHGTLKPGTDPLDLVRATFPGGTITGVPKLRCMEIIEELEPVRRGLYTGALGYFSWSGDLDLNILIRTLVLTRGQGYLQVGAGVVADSIPDREYEETLSKAGAFFKMLEER